MIEKDQIAEFLFGKLNLENRKKLKKWIASDENNQKYFSSKKNLWVASGINQDHKNIDLDSEFELLNLRLKNETTHSSKTLRLKVSDRNTKNFKYYFLRIAAALLLFYSIGISLYQISGGSVIEYSEITTIKGEKSKVVLADGTQIWLNSASTLRYPNTLDKKEVDLYLDGEAFFDVVKKDYRKLNVNTSSIRIQVLGTSFNVKAYNDEKLIETTLVRGSIMIDDKPGDQLINEPVMLKPNQHAAFVKGSKDFQLERISEKAENATKTNGSEKIKAKTVSEKPSLTIFEKVDVEDYTAWKDHRLVFKSERYEDLARKLERWYNVEITIKDESLKNSRYTGVFEKETIEQALEALSLSLPFDYIIDKNQIKIITKKSK